MPVESVYSNEPSARTEESTIHKTCAAILFYIIRDSLTCLSRVNWFSAGVFYSWCIRLASGKWTLFGSSSQCFLSGRQLSCYPTVTGVKTCILVRRCSLQRWQDILLSSKKNDKSLSNVGKKAIISMFSCSNICISVQEKFYYSQIDNNWSHTCFSWN